MRGGGGGRRADGKYRKRSGDRFPIGASCPGRKVCSILFCSNLSFAEGGGTQKIRNRPLSLSLSQGEEGSVFKRG